MLNKPFHRRRALIIYRFIGVFWLLMSIAALILGISLNRSTFIYVCIVLLVITLLTLILCIFERVKTVILSEDKIIFHYYYNKATKKFIKKLIILYDDVEYVQLKDSTNYLYDFQSQSITFQLKNGEKYELYLKHFSETYKQFLINYLIKKINANLKGE